jgi:multiple sugar transport system substrate-binding protein
MNRDYYNEKLVLSLDKPGAKEALDAAITMRKNGWDAKQGLWDNETYPAIGEGKIAMVVAGCWYGGFLKGWIAPKTSGLWGVARLPGKIADTNWGGSYLAIPSQGKHKDAAWKFVQFALATKDAQNTMFKTVDYFPGYIPAWSDAMYNEGDPYFGGQKARALWVSIAKSIKPTFSTLMDSTVDSILGTTVNTGLNEGLTSTQILEKAKAAIQEQTLEDRDNFIEIMKKAGKWK